MSSQAAHRDSKDSTELPSDEKMVELNVSPEELDASSPTDHEDGVIIVPPGEVS